MKNAHQKSSTSTESFDFLSQLQLKAAEHFQSNMLAAGPAAGLAEQLAAAEPDVAAGLHAEKRLTLGGIDELDIPNLEWPLESGGACWACCSERTRAFEQQQGGRGSSGADKHP